MRETVHDFFWERAAQLKVNQGKEIDPEKDTDDRIRQVNITKRKLLKMGNANIIKAIGFSDGKNQRRLGCNVR